MSVQTNLQDKLGQVGPYVLAAIFAIIASLGLFWAGVPPAIEQTNRDLRSDVFERQATGKVAVIELDSKSLQAIGSWPWPRAIHADLLKNLSDGGAEQVAFDVDFSARSNGVDDKKLAQAIDQSEASVILATFRQRSSKRGNAFIESLPQEPFRKNAFLASVNVHPDEIGQVSHYSYGTKISLHPRPTLATMLTNSNGELGKDFLLDQSINLGSIPAFSAIDVINGKVAPEDIFGRSFVVGASAIELGDNYATPHEGVIPGVFIHALAAETLLAGSDLPIVNGWVILAVTILFMLFWWRMMSRAKDEKIHLILPLFAALLVGSNWVLFVFSIAEVEIALSIIYVGCLFVSVWIVQLLLTMQRERHTDLATGLPNKAAMAKQAQKQDHVRVAVAQIANFAEIESLLDGDQQSNLLESIAKRLSLLAEEGLVYRTGSDQLAWFVSSEYADRLEEHFDTASAFATAPTITDSHRMRLSINLGHNEGVTEDWSKLFGDASIAAHKAAELNFRWMNYSQDLNEIISEKLAILNDIDEAMESGQIWVAYQPKLDLHDGTVNAAEALVRWKHPERGHIGPDRFIPVLEEQGRIDDLTLFVLKAALRDTKKWAHAGLLINCSVNVSAALLSDDKFVSLAVDLVQRSDVPVDQISFEITETAALGDLDQAKMVLEGIREIGVKLSIDDYGTGQSNLSYLQGFPADEIKIDQSFIKSMVHNDVDRVMVSSTIDMAHKMNFKVVAEGIEDLDCLMLLQKFRCDVAQGWHIGKPVDAEAFFEQWSKQDVVKTA